MTLLERLTQITGDETIAQNILNAGVMIPLDKFNEKLDEIKNLNTQITTLKDNHANEIRAKDNELYDFKTANMTELEKANADKEKMQKMLDELNINNTKAEARAKLAKAGIDNEERVNSIIETFITDDKEKSLNAIETLIGVRTETIEATKKQVEDGVLGDQQNTGGTDVTPPIKDDESEAFLAGLESVVANY